MVRSLLGRGGWLRAVQVVGAIVSLVGGAFLYHRHAPRHVPRGQPPLTHLSAGTREDLRAAFNAASDRTRLLLLLSPTCPVCLRGASAVEDILRSTSQPLRVLVVWEPVIATDLAAPTTGALARIADARAVQYWDPDRSISAYLVSVARAQPGWVPPQYRERLLADDVIIWDAALVFPAGSRWESTMPRPSFSGGPLVDELDAIRAALSGDRSARDPEGSHAKSDRASRPTGSSPAERVVRREVRPRGDEFSTGSYGAPVHPSG